jgi:hypothetical protein
MNRQMLKDHLGQADRQLAELAVRIEQQKTHIARLEAGGQDTAHASFLLQQARGLQRLHQTHRDWLKRELAKV